MSEQLKHTRLFKLIKFEMLRANYFQNALAVGYTKMRCCEQRIWNKMRMDWTSINKKTQWNCKVIHQHIYNMPKIVNDRPKESCGSRPNSERQSEANDQQANSWFFNAHFPITYTLLAVQIGNGNLLNLASTIIEQEKYEKMHRLHYYCLQCISVACGGQI